MEQNPARSAAPAVTNEKHALQPRPNGYFKRVGSLRVTALIAVCLLLPGAAFHAGATVSTSHAAVASSNASTTSVSIFLYDSNGQPVDVTSTTSYQEGHVFNISQQIIGSVPNETTGSIYDASSTCIGFIVVAPPPHP